MPTWTLKADRRKADYELIVAELRVLEQTVEGLDITVLDPTLFTDGPDAGGFRDFAPIAELLHPNIDALEIVGEELLAEFGWLVDFGKE